jgi:Lamin Tail Domain
MKHAVVLGTFAVVLVLVPAANALAGIRITKIQYDSPGSDTGSNTSLNAEYVVLKNNGSRAQKLTDWVLKDKAGHRFTFGTFKLAASKSVTIHTGKGSDDRNDLYWGSGWYIWNNDGDRATLSNARGHTVDTCTYAGGDTYVNC